jgi:hypothetical protein
MPLPLMALVLRLNAWYEIGQRLESSLWSLAVPGGMPTGVITFSQAAGTLLRECSTIETVNVPTAPEGWVMVPIGVTDQLSGVCRYMQLRISSPDGITSELTISALVKPAKPIVQVCRFGCAGVPWLTVVKVPRPAAAVP